MPRAARLAGAFGLGLCLSLARIDGLQPFGTAAFYGSLAMGPEVLGPLGAAVVLGSGAVAGGAQALASLATVTIGWALAKAAPPDGRFPAPSRQAALVAAGVTVLVRVVGWGASRAHVPHWWIETAAQSAATGALVRLWGPMLSALWGGVPWQTRAPGERAAASLSLAGAVCLGLQALAWGPLQPAAVASPFLTLAAASVGGAPAGASVAVVTASALALGDSRWVLYGLAVAAGGVAATAACGLRRRWMGVLAVASVAAASVSAPSPEWVGWALAHSAVAGLAFAAMPGRALALLERRLASWAGAPGPEDGAQAGDFGLSEPVVQWAAARVQATLAQLAGMVEALRAAYEAAPHSDGPAEQAHRLVEMVQARCCAACSSWEHCWEAHGYASFWDVLQLVQAARETGPGVLPGLPESLAARCVQPVRLSGSAMDVVSLVAAEEEARAKLQRESRRLACELEGVARVLEEARLGLGRQLQQVDGEAQARLARHLGRSGWPASWVFVCGRGARREVAVQLRRPCPGPGQCAARLVALVSEAEGWVYAARQSACRFGQDGPAGAGCRVELVRRPRFGVQVAFMTRCRSGEECSGDSFTRLELGPAAAALVVSDGMGSGPEAARESEAALRMACAALASGLDPAAAIRSANAALVARSVDERFATLDVVLLDLAQGELELAKAGAFPSFILRDGRLEPLEGRALPAGIVPSVEVEVLRRPVADGDALVMLTDGAARLGSAVEGCLQHAADLLAVGPDDPGRPDARQVAQTVMACLDQLTGGEWPDDVTAAVAVIHELDADPGLAYTDSGSMRPARGWRASKQRQRRSGSVRRGPSP